MNDQMGVVAGIVIIIVCTIFGVLAVRWFNSVANMVDVIQPKPGIECVVVTTTDGIAVDCNWAVPK